MSYYFWLGREAEATHVKERIEEARQREYDRWASTRGFLLDGMWNRFVRASDGDGN